MSDQGSTGAGARYRAFISYSRADRDAAAALQRRLERYVLPRTLRVVTAGVRRDPRPLKPIFRDESELVPGQDLSARIRQGLAEADFLIVVCSPAAAASRWVEREIADFIALGRIGNILAVVVDGEPNAEREGRDPALECLPPSLRDVEPLWVDWRATAAEDRSNFLRVVATLLSLRSFDDLIRRDAQFQRRQAINRLVIGGLAAVTIAGVAVGFGVMARNAAIAQSGALADAARKAAGDYDYESATRLALAGWRLSPEPSAEAALVAAVDASRRVGSPLAVPKDFVSHLVFSPDGKSFATGAYGEKIRIYDSASRKPIGAAFGGFENGVWRVAFSPDGKLLAACDFDTVRVFDVATHKQVGATMSGHKGLIFNIAFSRDGKRLASASEDTTARLWDVATGRMIGAPLQGPGVVFTADFSPDGRTLATAGGGGWLRLWDATTGKPRPAPELKVDELWYAPDGKTVAAVHGGEIGIWDAKTFKPVGEPFVTDNEFAFKMIVFSPDGTRLASLAGDNSVRVWDVATRKQIGAPFVGHREVVASVAISPDDRQLATTSADSTIRFWDINGHGQIGPPLTGHADEVASAYFLPDGKRVVSASLRLWDVSTGRQIGSPLVGLGGRIEDASVSADGRRVVGFRNSGGEKGGRNMMGEAQVWDTGTGRPVGARITTPRGFGFDSATFPRDGSGLRLITSRRGYDNNWDFWLADPATGKRIGAPFTNRAWILATLAYSPSGDRMVTGELDTTVRLWDMATHKQIKKFEGHLAVINSVAFSPDARKLVSASGDRTIRLWDIETGKQIGEPLLGHDGKVLSVAFSPDGARLASAAWDRTIRLWDVATGLQIGAPLTGHQGVVTSIDFSPDGKTLVSASRDRTVRLWDVDRRVHLRGEALIKVACSETLPQDLSRLRPTEVATAAKITLDYELDPCRPTPWWTKLGRYLGWDRKDRPTS